MNDPTLPVWADAIETLVAVGELEQARAYLERVRAERAAARKPTRRWRARSAAAACSPPPRATSTLALAAFEQRSRRAARAAVAARARRTLLCLGAVRRQAQQRKRRPGGARAGARDLRGARRPPLGREGAGGARADQRPARGLRRADRDGAAGRRARGAGPHQQGDRRRALHGREHGRGAPLPRLPQARHPLAHRARRLGSPYPRDETAKAVDEAAQA